MRKIFVLISILVISMSCEKAITTPKPSATANTRDVIPKALPAPIKSIIPTPSKLIIPTLEPTPPLGVDKLPRELLVIYDNYLKVFDKEAKLKTNIYVGDCFINEYMQGKNTAGFLQNKLLVLPCNSKSTNPQDTILTTQYLP